MIQKLIDEKMELYSGMWIMAEWIVSHLGCDGCPLNKDTCGCEPVFMESLDSNCISAVQDWGEEQGKAAEARRKTRKGV
jgi:hypothetical protein